MIQTVDWGIGLDRLTQLISEYRQIKKLCFTISEFEPHFVFVILHKFNNKNVDLVIQKYDSDDAQVKFFYSKEDVKFTLTGLD